MTPVTRLPSLPVAEGVPLDLIVPVFGLMVGIAFLVGIFLIFRKYLASMNDQHDATGGFALGGLRELVRQGKMTPEEYEQAKAGIVAAAHRQAAKAAEEKARDKPPQPPFTVT